MLSWSDNDSSPKTFTVSILDDNLAEGNETVGLALGNITGGATSGNRANATLTIEDVEPAGLLQFSEPTFNIDENAGVATISVSRQNGENGAVSVD